VGTEQTPSLFGSPTELEGISGGRLLQMICKDHFGLPGEGVKSRVPVTAIRAICYILGVPNYHPTL